MACYTLLAAAPSRPHSGSEQPFRLASRTSEEGGGRRRSTGVMVAVTPPGGNARGTRPVVL